MVRWVGVGLAVPILVLAATELSCLAGDLARALGGSESAMSEPAAQLDVPVRFEVDQPAPGGGPVLTR